MDEQVVLSIQGFFFQESTTLGVAMRPIVGAVAVLQRGLYRNMFAGVIYRDEWSGDWRGNLYDRVGESELSEIVVGPNTLLFTKRYTGRGDAIEYQFALEAGVWIGTWEGEMVGCGQANCLLTPAPAQLFNPHAVTHTQM